MITINSPVTTQTIYMDAWVELGANTVVGQHGPMFVLM